MANEKKEKYVPAEMEIIKFEAEDVIRTSGLETEEDEFQ